MPNTFKLISCIGITTWLSIADCTTQEDNCLPDGTECSFSKDCCSGKCAMGQCQSTSECRDNESDCEQDDECCSHNCDQGQCANMEDCLENGDGCTQDNGCCSQYCDENGQCANKPIDKCRPAQDDCSEDGQCCSEDCKDGKCKEGGSTESYGFCCLNSDYYDCSTKDAFLKCMGFDMDACMKACEPSNFECSQDCFEKWTNAENDPSSCDRDSDRDGECEQSPMGCVAGDSCDYDSDCDSQNCYENKCYAKDNGCPCEYDSDCTSQNCTNNVCEGNGTGSSCDYDSDCSSQNCYQGKCYGNDRGDPCEYDSDCDSQNCYQNECQ